MGSSTSCDRSVSASVEFKSCLYGTDSEGPSVKHEKSFILDENVEEIFLDDVDSSSSEEDEHYNDLMVNKLDGLLRETMHIEDNLEPLCLVNSTLSLESMCSQLEVNPLPFDMGAIEGVNMHAEIVCSDLENSDSDDGLSHTTAENVNFSDAGSLAFLQPLDTTVKLRSALKGGRAQHGIHLDRKLNVKWAPDVYEPPVTSSSHTVKGHRRRRHYQQHHQSHHAACDKHNKGKSARGFVSAKKHAQRRNSNSNQADAQILRLQALGRNGSLLNSCGQSKIESLDLAIGSREAREYGSSCYMESIAPVRLPVAKAS